MEEYYIGSYWLGRSESAEACARRAEACFQLLANSDPIYKHWFETADSLEEALLSRVSTDASALLSIFTRRERDDIEDWHSLRAWNGSADETSCSLSLTCGSASQWVSNTCVLDLPSGGSAAERLLSVPQLSKLLRAMVMTWEPEWSVATSNESRELLSADGEAGTFVGWLSYFSRRRGEVPALPAPVRVEPVEGHGTLIVLTPERFTASNPAHLALAREVAERLSQTGLLRPLQRWS